MTRHLTILLLVATLGCAGTKRDTQTYRTDTQKVLETRSGQLQSCYEAALKDDPQIKGLLTVRFSIENKTGAFTKLSIDPTRSSSKEPLVSCVATALAGLKLDPPDRNPGQATFVYELRPAPAS